MTVLREYLRRLWGALRRNPTDHDLERELRFHLEQAEDELRRKGHSPAEAARLARVRLGGIPQVMEALRDQRGWPWLDDLRTDVRIGVRGLMRRPGFTATAALTLALGIGVNAVVFSVSSAMFMRPLQYEDPDTLVSIGQFVPAFDASLVPRRVFAAWREENRFFTDIAAYSIGGSAFNLTGGSGPERVAAATVSSSFLTVLAGRPALGRFFEPADERAGAPAVAVLSHGLWTRRFGRDGAVLGRTVALNDASFTVIGVAPRDFRFPGPTERAVFVPLQRADESAGAGLFFVNVVGRLDPGVTAAQADSDLQAIGSRNAERLPGDLGQMLAGAQVHVRPLQDVLMANAAGLMPVLAGVALFVLAIAGVNVANLQLGRMRARQREFSVRTALGATRLAMVRQILIENLLLSALGGVAALLLVYWSVGWAGTLLSQVVPYPEDVRVDGWVLISTMVTVGVMGFASGLGPALAATRQDKTDALNSSMTGMWTAPGRDGRVLLIGEVALTVVLLVAAGLLIRSLQNLTAIPPGFDPQHVLTAQLSLPVAGYPADGQRLAFVQRVLEGVRALPGVESAAASTGLPLWGSAGSVPWTVDHPATVEGAPIRANYDVVSAGYFDTLGIPLLDGRDFALGDSAGSQPVAIVTQRFARRITANESLVGERIRAGAGDWLTVVGIVGDVRHRDPDGDVPPHVYRPLAQAPPSTVFFATRAAAGAAPLVAGLRNRVHALDGDLPLYSVATMEQRLRRLVTTERTGTLAVGVFAVLALMLATVGLYSVVARWLAERRRELGVRVALGAGRRDILAVTVGRVMRIVMLGLGVGLLAAPVAGRLLSAFLYEIAPTDPLTLLAVALLLCAVALLAVAPVARRAMRLDVSRILNADQT